MTQVRIPFEDASNGEGFTFPNYDVELSLLRDIHVFFESLNGLSVADSCIDEGLRDIIVAFKTLLKSQKCYNALYNFEILLEEKGLDDPYRANGTTPNILHEIRNCAHILGMISTGYIPMDVYAQHGGLDADLSARFRHDSIEDKAKSKTFHIYTGMERNLERLFVEGEIDEELHWQKRMEATLAAEMTDVMTRKDAFLDPETGQVVTKTNGKILKKDRYGGNINIYWQKMLPYPLAILGKYADRSENVGTRYSVEKFTLESNIKYAMKTRYIYGNESHDDVAMEKWPQFAYAIKASDDMLGIQLTMLETMNFHLDDEQSNPRTGNPIRLSKYAPYGLHAYHTIPQCLHPISVAAHDYRRHHENTAKIRSVLENKLAPAIRMEEDKYGLNPIKGLEFSQSIFFGPHPPSKSVSPS